MAPASMAPTPGAPAPASGPGFSRLALFALVLAFPLGMLPQVLWGTSPEAPLPRTPARSDVVVVSVGGWGDGPDADTPHLAAFERRADRVPAVAPSVLRAHAAVGLWTSRYPGSLGLVAGEDRLAGPGSAPWTLADAMVRSGGRSAAFLQEPLVSTTGLGGFERVREDPDAGAEALAEDAAAFVAEHPDERLVLWLHLDLAGPTSPAGLDAAFARLDAALAASGRLASAARVLCRLDGDPDRPDAPLLVSLPGALYPGRRAAGRVSLVDVAGMLRVLLKLPPPVQTSPPTQARVELLWNALRGGDSPAWAVMQDGGEDLFYQGDERVRRKGDTAGTAELVAERWDGTGWRPVEDARRPALLGQARAAFATLE